MRQILNTQDCQLRQIIDRSQELTRLAPRIKQFLKEDLAQHCTVANFQEGCLVIAVDNAAWATHLRYQIPALLQCLRSKGKLYNLRTIRSYIKSPQQSIPKQARLPTRLSPYSANIIMNKAIHIKDQALRNALLHLAAKKPLSYNSS